VQLRENNGKTNKREEERRKKHPAKSCCQYWIRMMWQCGIFCYNSARSERTKDITLLTENYIINMRTRTYALVSQRIKQWIILRTKERNERKLNCWRSWPASPLCAATSPTLVPSKWSKKKPCRQFVISRVWRK
jgi:hypothetical protein